MSNTNKAYGVDISAYQNPIEDWNIIKNYVPKIVFMGIRSTISWGYKDKFFAMNWEGAKSANVLRAAYHVVYPGESPQKQMDNLFSMFSNGIYDGELPLVLDIELDHGYSPQTISTNILSCANIILTRTGRNPIFYTRASWVDQFMGQPDWLDNYDWWLANYLSSGEEWPNDPALPRGVTKWLILQSSSRGNGKQHGVFSASIDQDRWNGKESDVYAYANISHAQPGDPMENNPQLIEAINRIDSNVAAIREAMDTHFI